MREFERIKKKCKKIIRKMFGYKTIAIALREKENLRLTIEAIVNKPIKNIDYSDIKRNRLWSEYSEYCTLKSILDSYIDAVIIEKFTRS